MKPYFLSLFFILSFFAQAQDATYAPNIRTAQLYRSGDQTSFPVISVNTTDALQLEFDDLDADIKNYYYSFQLCNADWSPSMLRPFEYLKGFQSIRITTYRNSSLSFTRYTHYQASVPDRNCVPNRSGNYLLRVFLNGDTSKIVFTKRMVVVDDRVKVGAVIQQPYSGQLFRTAHKLQVVVRTDERVQNLSPNDLKIVVLQNYNWRTSLFIDRPSIYRGNYYEYSDEPTMTMPAGKEFRWIDLRSFRLLSDRMERMDNSKDSNVVYIKPDPSREGNTYLYYRDLNGTYSIETLESINPFWQADYGWVHFTYVPPNNRGYEGRDVYIFGELTNYGQDPEARMDYNADKGVYEKTLFLKQGYYNYQYVTLPQANPQNAYPDVSATEGNYWGTENAYTILVYYRPFGARADELVGYTTLNSAFEQRTGY
jgi:hypothetical protein